MQCFCTNNKARVLEMGFTSTKAEGIARVFDNMDVDASGRVSEDEFLAYFGLGPLSHAGIAAVQQMKDDMKRRDNAQAADVAATQPPCDESTHRLRELRKGGPRRVMPDGKIHAYSER